MNILPIKEAISSLPASIGEQIANNPGVVSAVALLNIVTFGAVNYVDNLLSKKWNNFFAKYVVINVGVTSAAMVGVNLLVSTIAKLELSARTIAIITLVAVIARTIISLLQGKGSSGLEENPRQHQQDQFGPIKQESSKVTIELHDGSEFEFHDGSEEDEDESAKVLAKNSPKLSLGKDSAALTEEISLMDEPVIDLSSPEYPVHGADFDKLLEKMQQKGAANSAKTEIEILSTPTTTPTEFVSEPSISDSVLDKPSDPSVIIRIEEPSQSPIEILVEAPAQSPSSTSPIKEEDIRKQKEALVKTPNKVKTKTLANAALATLKLQKKDKDGNLYIVEMPVASPKKGSPLTQVISSPTLAPIPEVSV